jgi:hypothetical protein
MGGDAMSHIDIAKARQLIASIADVDAYMIRSDAADARVRSERKALADMLPAALDRIEQLQAALVEACALACELSSGVASDYDSSRVYELRALAAGEVTP